MNKGEKISLGFFIFGIIGILVEIGERSISGVIIYLIWVIISELVFFIFHKKKHSTKPNKQNKYTKPEPIQILVRGTYYLNQKPIAKLMPPPSSPSSANKYGTLKTYATLVEEPTNKYDKDAIKVLISGVHVGYIPAEECCRFKTLIHNNRIVEVIADVTGGPRQSPFGGYDNTSFQVNLTIITK